MKRGDAHEVLASGATSDETVMRASVTGVLFLATVLLPRSAGAGETEPHRMGAAATLSLAHLHRSSSEPSAVRGPALGGELRLHPHSRHGIALGYTASRGIFGPSVVILDGGYSYRILGSRRLDGLTGALYADIGPALGFVSRAPPARDHVVLGGRASIAADAQLWNVTAGAILAYRAGAPLHGTPDAWEGALSVGLRVGLVFDAD